MENKEKVFVSGMIFKRPLPNAPEWVKGKISVNVDNFTKFCRENAVNGWINIDLLKSKEKGTLYLALNTYKKVEQPRDDVKPDYQF
jgi:hypothetical protein